VRHVKEFERLETKVKCQNPRRRCDSAYSERVRSSLTLRTGVDGALSPTLCRLCLLAVVFAPAAPPKAFFRSSSAFAHALRALAELNVDVPAIDLAEVFALGGHWAVTGCSAAASSVSQSHISPVR